MGFFPSLFVYDENNELVEGESYDASSKIYAFEHNLQIKLSADQRIDNTGKNFVLKITKQIDSLSPRFYEMALARKIWRKVSMTIPCINDAGAEFILFEYILNDAQIIDIKHWSKLETELGWLEEISFSTENYIIRHPSRKIEFCSAAV